MKTADAPKSLTISTPDDRVLDVLVSGPVDGTVLVFHSGTPCGLVPLPDSLDPAPLGIRTVLYARPGYGRSTPQPGRSVADGAADTATILDAIGVERFLNLGWSGGGPHALACGALLSDRCRATAVIAGLAPYAEDQPGGVVRSHYEADEDNRNAIAGDSDAFRRACEEFGAQLLMTQAENVSTDAKSAADRQYLSGEYGEWVAAFFRAGYVAGIEGDAGDGFAFLRPWGFTMEDIRGGVAIWHGSEDENVPLVHSRWLSQHLPRATLTVRENEGHASILRYLPDILRDLMAIS